MRNLITAERYHDISVGHRVTGHENKIILEYTEDGCERVKDALSKIAATSEEAVWLLLKLDK